MAWILLQACQRGQGLGRRSADPVPVPGMVRWGWIHTWVSLKAESSSDYPQNIAAWFALELPSGISADGKLFPACPNAAPWLPKQSVTFSLSTLYIFPPPSLLRAGVNMSKSSPHPCLCLGTQSRDLGTTADEHFAYIVFTQCWEVLGTPRGHLRGGSKNVPLSHFTE